MIVIEKYAKKCACWTTNVYQKSLSPNDPKADSRYQKYYKNGPSGLMLHSVGCAQPSADVFADGWNRESKDDAMCHGVIDANDGNTRQTLRWDYRAWHCGSGSNGSANNTHIGIEMCESNKIRYLQKGEPGYSAGKFEILDKAAAQNHARVAYNGAVELFAMLCVKFKLDPLTQIISHKEGHTLGIASNHGDPEHYWKGLGMPYTMDTFRAAVNTKKKEMEEVTTTECTALIQKAVAPLKEQIAALQASVQSLTAVMNNENIASIMKAEFGKSMASYLNSLKDNDAGGWSKGAREWAVANGLIAGVGPLPDGTPNYAWEAPLTREQYVTVEYRKHLNEMAE